MRNLLIAGILMLFETGAAFAQTAPKTEFFVGYQYQHLNPGGRGCQGLGLNLAYNLNDWLGGGGRLRPLPRDRATVRCERP